VLGVSSTFGTQYPSSQSVEISQKSLYGYSQQSQSAPAASGVYLSIQDKQTQACSTLTQAEVLGSLW